MTRTLLVGNGEWILGRGLGPEIDSFENVVRFNRFELKPVEDTGKKVDLHVRIQGIPIHKDAKESWVSYWLLDRDRIRRALPHDILLPEKSVLGAYNTLAKEGFTPNGKAQRPEDFLASTGFTMIHHFTKFLGEPVTLVNMDHGKTGHYFKEHHKHGWRHDFDLERRVVNRFVEEGLVHRLDPENAD